MEMKQPVIVYTIYSFEHIIESDLLRCFYQRNSTSVLTDVNNPCLLKALYSSTQMPRSESGILL